MTWARLTRVVGLAAVSSMLASCPTPPTDIEVVIASDLSLSQLNGIRLRGGNSWDEPTDTFSGGADLPYSIGPGSAQITLPQSFAMVPSTTQSVIAVVDNGSSSGGAPTPVTLRRVVRVSDMHGVSGQVVIWLSRACLATVTAGQATPCPTGMTSCTMSQSCETQMMTCGNDGCCRGYDITMSELGPPSDAGPEAGLVVPATPPPGDCGVSAPADANADAPPG